MTAEQMEHSDAALITAVRAGDEAAYGQLWQRHESAARRLAVQLTNPSNAEDLVSESFLKILRILKEGGGPDGAFRPYLFSTIRRLNIDQARSYYSRVDLTDDETTLEVATTPSAAEVLADNAEGSAAWQAWESLPDSSRTLLWHLLIEEETPAQIAPLVGTSPNGVSSRAVRAKERLRQAFLQQHLLAADNEECRQARECLGPYVRGALSSRDRAKLEAHLDRCERCRAAWSEVSDINATLRAAIAPLILGGAVLAGKYLSGGGASKLTLAGWRHRVQLRPRVAVAAAAAAGVVLASGIGAAISATRGASPRAVADTAGLPAGPLAIATGPVGPPGPTSAATAPSGASPTPRAAPPGSASTIHPAPTPAGSSAAIAASSRRAASTPAAVPSSARSGQRADPTPTRTASPPVAPPATPPGLVTIPAAGQPYPAHALRLAAAGVLPVTYDIATTGSWVITAISMADPSGDPEAPCVITPGGGSAECVTAADPVAGTYPVTLTVRGPGGDSTSRFLTGSGAAFCADASLCTTADGPINPPAVVTGQAAVSVPAGAVGPAVVTLTVPAGENWDLGGVHLTPVDPADSPGFCSGAVGSWTCTVSQPRPGARYLAGWTATGPSADRSSSLDLGYRDARPADAGYVRPAPVINQS